MKYIRYKKEDQIYAGILEDDIIYQMNTDDILKLVKDEKKIKNNYKNNKSYPVGSVKILTPVCPTKIVCVGLNYIDHANEFDMKIPEEPLLFIKPSTSIIPTDSNIIYPESCSQLDFEAELAIVIAEKIHKQDFKDEYIAGYTIVNDVTARDLQNKDGQWTRSKSFDTFCPTGPTLVTGIDPENQIIQSKVNGNIKQDSNTKNMIFNTRQLVEYISNIMTLNPGDIIATGTPPGVDHVDCKDLIEIIIEDIGVLKNKVDK